MTRTSCLASRSGVVLAVGILGLGCSRQGGPPVAGDRNQREDAAGKGASADAGADAAVVDAGEQRGCSALRLLTVSEPTLSTERNPLDNRGIHEPWPADGRLTVRYSGQAFEVGVRLTNGSTTGVSLVGVWLACSNEARVWNGGMVWFESIAPNATMVASVTVQQNPGELSCTWHKVMGSDPLRTEGCSAEALDIHLSIQLE